MVRALALFSIAFSIAATLAAADLTGLVVAEHDGSPVIGAAVTLRSADKVVAEFETDDSGRFRAAGLPTAEYVVVATKASFTTAERRIALSQAGANVLLQVTKLGVISGRVTDGQGNGIRNIVVAAVPAAPDGGALRTYGLRPAGAVTDASGRYRIFGLPAGDYVVLQLAGNARSIASLTNGVTPDTSRGSTADYYPSNRAPRVLSIRSGEQHTNIDLKGYTGPLFTVRGTVSGPGPETPYRVSLVAEVVGIPVSAVTAQPGKEFQFDRVAPGTYKLVATRQVSAATSLLEAINSGQIVLSAANEAAILQQLAAERAANPLAAQAEPVFGETTITVSQDLTGVTLSARPGVDTKLIYQPAKGCPASVQLTLNPTEYMGVGGTNKKLEAGKELLLTGIPSAAYSIALTLPESSGCYAATPLIDFRQVSPGTAVPIIAANMGHVQGKVDTTASLTEEFTIALIAPDGFTKRTLALAKDSSFSIPNLRPGRYRLSVTRRSATRTVAADQQVVVESGATAQVDFPALP
ncbi:MAG: carboxypeptidase regulatory-like domain-containing protein [Acidobacteriota bacterium]